MELTKGTWKKRRSATGSWQVDTDNERIAEEIRQCNADAIAAVPEMVEALEMYECYEEYGATKDAWQIVLPRLRTALAKARGEQQDVQA